MKITHQRVIWSDVREAGRWTIKRLLEKPADTRRYGQKRVKELLSSIEGLSDDEVKALRRDLLQFVRGVPMTSKTIKVRKYYWAGLKQYFGAEEALCIYLARFPEVVLEQKSLELTNYLSKGAGYPDFWVFGCIAEMRNRTASADGAVSKVRPPERFGFVGR